MTMDEVTLDRSQVGTGFSVICGTSIGESKRSFSRIFELIDVFSPSPMPLCERIFLGARSPHVIFPRILAGKDYAHEAHTFG